MPMTFTPRRLPLRASLRRIVLTICLTSIFCFVLVSISGCSKQKKTASNKNRKSATKKSPVKGQNTNKSRNSGNTKKNNSTTNNNKPTGDKNNKPPRKNPPRKDGRDNGPSLGDLLQDDKDQPAFGSPEAMEKLKIDPQRVASKGIRKLTGKHLTLYTDLPAGKEIDALPRIFDLAVPQWCAYFQIDPKKVESWQMTGFLIGEKERFAGAGLMPEYLPPFLYGYQLGHELWVYEQPSAYYRRHLLLHEGTHAFMAWFVGGTGPPWYSEGMAELLGTHRFSDGKLTLNYFPKDRQETPFWGRVKIVQDEFKAQRGKALLDIMQYDSRAHRQNEPYGWCWAATIFFDRHPRYRQAFAKLRSNTGDVTFDFSTKFYQSLKADWPQISEQWQLFVVEMDYGYDVAQAEVTHRPGESLPADGAEVTVQADKGWQSSGVRLEAGQTYRITAAGRYQVGRQPKPWWCEPGGVTIRYYRGKPLGMLTGAIRPDDFNGQTITPLAFPEPIGLERQFRCQRSGTLYLRINEFCGALADNTGQLSVNIETAEAKTE